VVLVQRFKVVRRDGLDPAALSDAEVFEVFGAHAEGQLTRASVLQILTWWLQLPPEERSMSNLLQAQTHPPVTGAELDHWVADLVVRTRQTPFRSPEARLRSLTGRLIRESAGRVDGREAAECLARSLGDSRLQVSSKGGQR